MTRLRTILAIVVFFGLGCLFSGLKTTLAQPETKSPHRLPAIIFVEAPETARGDLAGRFPQGSHLALLSTGAAFRSARNLTPGFFAVADPQVSFEGSHVFFAGRKTRGSRWQIWEMNADGSAKHRLTHRLGDCLQPVCLPGKQIVFTMVRGKGASATAEIYVAQENGANAHRITFGPGNFQVETVLRSGRILVSAKSSLVAGGNSNEAREFYVLRPDGSGLSPFRGNSAPNFVRTGATELDDGTVLFVKRPDHGGRMKRGELAWIRPGALHNSVLTPANADYWSAHQLDGNLLVVSKAESGASGAPGRFGLYVFNLSTRRVERAIYRDPKLSGVEAVPLEPRKSPLEYHSILHPDRHYGRIVCLDSHLSAGAPQGRLTGHIAQVRVIALQPDHHSERVLGEAPVESDGSFYIKVPADQPIRFELLNGKGMVIRAQKSWIWARTGEDVPCLGCHESKALVPGDHWPMALKRQAGPVPVGMNASPQPAKH